MRFADGALMDLDRSTEVAIPQDEAIRHAVVKKGILYVTTLGSDKRPIEVATPHAFVVVTVRKRPLRLTAKRRLLRWPRARCALPAPAITEPLQFAKDIT